jgi:hypothetical protein
LREREVSPHTQILLGGADEAPAPLLLPSERNRVVPSPLVAHAIVWA